jgi:hypothetical protein
MYGRFLIIAGLIFPVFIFVEPLGHTYFVVSILMLATAGILDLRDLLAE